MKDTEKPSLFSPVNVGRASEDIALQIEAAIVGAEIVPGQRLPSERELQSQFGTGRGVVREALRALKQKGLVEIRKGAKGGAYVKQIEATSFGESLAIFLKQKQVDPDQLIEFRESIDRVVTTLAIAHAGPEEKSALVRITDRLEEFGDDVAPDMEKLAEIDRALNIQLAKMTGNPIFEWVMQAVQLGFSSHDFALYDDPDYRQATIANWKQTVREIAANKPNRALSSITYHYILLRRCLGNGRKQAEGPLEVVAR
ncbi:MAG: FadR/GntR family transcriptional regulator [Desulfopila sp.]